MGEARVLIEHTRTMWSIRELAGELSPHLGPEIYDSFPVFRVHTGLYGRHWDMLEWILDGLELQHPKGEPLRMAEMGVACGPIGLFLLKRFPALQYVGADPTIKPEVLAAYKPHNARAK